MGKTETKSKDTLGVGCLAQGFGALLVISGIVSCFTIVGIIWGVFLIAAGAALFVYGGRKAREKVKVCPKCRKSVDPEALICPFCRYDFEKTETTK